MGKWFAAVAAVVLVTGCKFGAGAFSCDNDEQCGASGKCELDHGKVCSFPDSGCMSGRRFGDLAGAQSNKCVGDQQQGNDASIPPPEIDARTCFGTTPFTICLVSAPTIPLTISTSKTINTDDPSMCEAVEAIRSGGDGYCVLAATSITVDAKLRATGTKPLVLVASGSITTSAVIDVGSHRGEIPETGAGTDPSTCETGTLPVMGNTSGGGAGGSFTGSGGIGGAGGNSGGAGGVPGGALTTITMLRGGCAGQAGQGAGNGTGGHGGGAVYLIAGISIDIGGGINAAGEGGNAATSGASGGGGGGAGGMIGFDAPSVAASGLILANGGGGGQGSGTGTPGRPGSDPSGITAALGGVGGGTASTNGGNGGNGSAGAAAGPGAPGNAGTNGSGGGGAGGGGAGLVKAPTGANLGTQVSPAATP